MKKNFKVILSILVCAVALIWLIPTVFVTSTVCEIKDYELVDSKGTVDTYKITYAYSRNEQIKTGTYTAKYHQSFIPMVGEQEVCHYLTIPPYLVFKGDAPSPVPPLVLLAIGVLIYVGKRPKFLRKKETKNESQP